MWNNASDKANPQQSHLSYTSQGHLTTLCTAASTSTVPLPPCHHTSKTTTRNKQQLKKTLTHDSKKVCKCKRGIDISVTIAPSLEPPLIQSTLAKPVPSKSGNKHCREQKCTTVPHVEHCTTLLIRIPRLPTYIRANTDVCSLARADCTASSQEEERKERTGQLPPPAHTVFLRCRRQFCTSRLRRPQRSAKRSLATSSRSLGQGRRSCQLRWSRDAARNGPTGYRKRKRKRDNDDDKYPT